MEEITNFYQTTENIGTSGQPTREQFEKIARQGYAAVINLAMPDSEHAIVEEGSIVSALGMNYYHIPVPFDAPTIDHLRQFSAVLDSMGTEKVWVHCAVNARVSAFMYHYMVKRGMSEEEAKSPVFKNWEPRMDDVWKSFINLTQDEIGL